MTSPTILVFDSGLGGLTVYREIAAARTRRPRLVYAADDAFFPYGRHGEAALVARVVPLMGELIARTTPDLVVIACNTASVQVLPHAAVALLRCAVRRHRAGDQAGLRGVEDQARRRARHRGDRQARIHPKADRRLSQGCGGRPRRLGAAFAAIAEDALLRAQPVDDAAIAAEIAPCFVDADGQRTANTVVLACTHFPLLLDRLERLAPWPVAWIDPAPAIARRVLDLLGPAAGAGALGPAAQAMFTSGKRRFPQPLAAALAGFGDRRRRRMPRRFDRPGLSP